MSDNLGCCGKELPTTLPLQNSPRRIVTVAGAVLINNRNEVLVCERPNDKPMAGFWEFPGGKLQSGEMPEYALVRELHEELGILTCTECLQPFYFVSHDYGEMHILMPLFVVRKWRGTPHGLEGQNIKWVGKHDLPTINWLPADKMVVPFVQDLL